MSSEIMFRHFLLAPCPHAVLLYLTWFHKSRDARVGSSLRDKKKCKVTLGRQAGSLYLNEVAGSHVLNSHLARTFGTV